MSSNNVESVVVDPDVQQQQHEDAAMVKPQSVVEQQVNGGTAEQPAAEVSAEQSAAGVSGGTAEQPTAEISVDTAEQPAAEASGQPVAKSVCMSASAEYASYLAKSAQLCWAVTNFKAPFYEPTSRAPVDIVAVIDKSGSMSGQKLRLVKKTLLFVIDQCMCELVVE